MKKRSTTSSSTTLLTGVLLCTALSQAFANDYVAPRTEWGHPELRGVWNFSSSIPLQRPAALGERALYTVEEVQAQEQTRIQREQAGIELTNIIGGTIGGYNDFWLETNPLDFNLRTSLIIDPPNGRLPPVVPDAPTGYGGLGPDSAGERPVRFTVGGVGKAGPEDRGLSERCLMGFNSVPPFEPSLYNNNLQIFQTEDHVVIFNEMVHEARIVSLDGSPHIPGNITQWNGDSRGYWDGETLVVETRNFNNKTQTFAGVGVSADKLLTERFTRSGADQVDYRYTVEDAKAFTASVTAEIPMFRMDGELYEYACHEGNYGLVNVLQGARVEEGTWDYENNRAIQN
ncbi:hypothetical protein E3V39_10930 [Gammaproteobacteria bacterium LSUCC0112]|nr:hypothetical protein E3V39_10930 [Gammaproteobacteria bacterium LSUCC0112]